MNYTSLKANINDICETSFSDDQLAMFTQQAEQKIFNSVDLPAMRNVDSGPLTATNKLYTTPDGYLYTYSIAVISSSTTNYLLNKDVNFLRDAYPVNTSAKYGLPKFYAYHSTSGSNVKLMLAPTPDQNYEIEHIYAKYPTSIVTAGGTYLGDNFDTALLNGALVEAIRFQKGEPDIIQNYEKMFLYSLTLLKGVGDGKLKQDYYRSGQIKQGVS
mgnify:CR=1 FL=1|tara:strand:- start:1335 stop:1979 length:645 start_codon:yes stop_codon:yes gene_type:complete